MRVESHLLRSSTISKTFVIRKLERTWGGEQIIHVVSYHLRSISRQITLAGRCRSGGRVTATEGRQVVTSNEQTLCGSFLATVNVL